MKENINIVELFITCDIITPIKNNNQLILVSDANQKTYIPLFTSQEQYEKWNISYPTIPVRLPQIITMIQTNLDIDGIVINPFDQNIIFEKEDIQNVLNQNIPFTKNEAVRIQDAKQCKDLIKHIQKQCKKDDNIIQAYLVLMTREINDESSYLVVLDALNYNEQLCQTIAQSALNYLKDTDKLDFISIDTDFGQQIALQSIPIYTKPMN